MKEALSSTPWILFIEDNSDDRVLTQRAIIRSSWKGDVSSAASAEQAFTLLEHRSIPPSLLLVDHGLKDLDGIKLISKIKSNPRYRDVPIVMMSNRTAYEMEEPAILHGAKEYLQKPVDLAEYMEAIVRIVDGL